MYKVTIPYRGMIPHLLKRGPIGTPIEISNEMYEAMLDDGVPMHLVEYISNDHEPVPVTETETVEESSPHKFVGVEIPKTAIDRPSIVSPVDVPPVKDIEIEVIIPDDTDTKKTDDPEEGNDDVTDESTETGDNNGHTLVDFSKGYWTPEELEKMSKNQRKKCKKIMEENKANA